MPTNPNSRGVIASASCADTPYEVSTYGTEFHSYPAIESATGTKFYFATPHQAWERGTCENTIGLIRQYLPKRTSMKRVSQLDCFLIAHQLNHRPRKRLGYLTPAECYERSTV